MTELLEIFARAAACVTAIVVLTRLNGLRSFSKMSSFDFAVTVAYGSVIASAVISPDETILYGLAVLTALFFVQGLIGLARAHFAKARQLVDNKPLLIMENGAILEHNLTRSRLTQDDLMAKLREANAFDLLHVHAVVFETTGDVSVLHGDPRDNKKISSEVLQDVRR